MGDEAMTEQYTPTQAAAERLRAFAGAGMHDLQTVLDGLDAETARADAAAQVLDEHRCHDAAERAYQRAVRAEAEVERLRAEREALHGDEMWERALAAGGKAFSDGGGHADIVEAVLSVLTAEPRKGSCDEPHPADPGMTCWLPTGHTDAHNIDGNRWPLTIPTDTTGDAMTDHDQEPSRELSSPVEGSEGSER